VLKVATLGADGGAGCVAGSPVDALEVVAVAGEVVAVDDVGEADEVEAGDDRLIECQVVEEGGDGGERGAVEDAEMGVVQRGRRLESVLGTGHGPCRGRRVRGGNMDGGDVVGDCEVEGVVWVGEGMCVGARVCVGLCLCLCLCLCLWRSVCKGQRVEGSHGGGGRGGIVSLTGGRAAVENPGGHEGRGRGRPARRRGVFAGGARKKWRG
jgi:hypothetical protein